MLRCYGYFKLVASTLLSVMLLAGTALAQSPAIRPEEPLTSSLKSEVDSLKAENAAVWELLRRMEDQQKVLLEQVDRLQQRLDGGTTAVAKPSADSLAPLSTPDLEPAAPVMAAATR